MLMDIAIDTRNYYMLFYLLDFIQVKSFGFDLDFQFVSMKVIDIVEHIFLTCTSFKSDVLRFITEYFIENL